MSEEDGTVLAFLNEVAGGRRLLEALRERTADGGSVALAAPQNQPVAGQLVDQDEVREAAQSRVEVTQAVLSEFGVDAVGVVMDPDPPLALDDAVRAFSPREILISCLAETRFGLLRRDLVEWARGHFETPITHIPVRIDEILISTFAGEQSKWLQEGLVEKVEAMSDKPVEHVEAGRGVAAAPPRTEAPVASPQPPGERV